MTASGPAGEVRASDVLAAAQRGAVNATALAKKYAEVNGVDLSAVSGTGHDGKNRKNDVLHAAAPAQRENTRNPQPPNRKPDSTPRASTSALCFGTRSAWLHLP